MLRWLDPDHLVSGCRLPAAFWLAFMRFVGTRCEGPAGVT
jgi:hypothetical protein